MFFYISYNFISEFFITDSFLINLLHKSSIFIEVCYNDILRFVKHYFRFSSKNCRLFCSLELDNDDIESKFYSFLGFKLFLKDEQELFCLFLFYFVFISGYII